MHLGGLTNGGGLRQDFGIVSHYLGHRFTAKIDLFFFRRLRPAFIGSLVTFYTDYIKLFFFFFYPRCDIAQSLFG